MTRDKEPRLGPAEPTDFQWLDEGPGAETAGAETAGAEAAGEVAPGEQAAGAGPPGEEPTTRCPRCGVVVGALAFCESCGASLQPGADGAQAESVVGPAEPATERGHGPGGMLVLGGPPAQGTPVVGGHPGEADGVTGAGPGGLGNPYDLGTQLPLPNGGICVDCGGTYDGDGYCEQCGAKAADPRHHFEIAEGPWVGGVCDRGVRHPGNEDALALRAQRSPAGGLRAALVVCDGVSTAPRSAQASLAAAQAAVEVLAASRARGMGVKEALVGALGQRVEAAADAANEAVVAVGSLPPGPEDGPPSHGYEAGGPSCTLVAAAIEDGLAVIGNVGDSRAYWFPDDGEPTLLTSDDSWAAEAMRAGASREEAETGPHAHTITRWLGPDAPDHTPVATALDVTDPGWLLLCSDGLWNYASEPAQLATVLAEAVAQLAAGGGIDGADERGDGPPVDGPVALAQLLVDWANAQGGHDNITVALARLFPAPAAPDAAIADAAASGTTGAEPAAAGSDAVRPDAVGPDDFGPGSAGSEPTASESARSGGDREGTGAPSPPSAGQTGGEALFEERPKAGEPDEPGVPSQERGPATEQG